MRILDFFALTLFAGAGMQSAWAAWRLRDWRLAFGCMALLLAGLPGLVEFLVFTRPLAWEMDVKTNDVQFLAIGLLAVMATWFIQRVIISHKREAEARNESEQLLASILENVPDAILTINRDGKVLFLNHSDSQYSVDDVVGSDSFRFLPSESHAEIREALSKVFDGGELVELEVPMIDLDGSQRWYTCRIVPSGSDGHPETATVIATNITQRKQDEDELRRSRDELECRVAERTRELALANQELRSEIIERKQTEKQLSFRIAFEQTISGLSSRFIDLEPEKIDAGIEEALKRFGELTGTDHCFICRVTGTPPVSSITHRWSRDGNRPEFDLFHQIRVDSFPWLWQKTSDLEPIEISDVDELPFEANRLRNALLSRDMRSMIVVPLTAGHVLWGYIGFAVEGRRVSWHEDTSALLKIIGEIVLSAMERHRADEALRATEARLNRLFQSNIIGSTYTDVEGILYDANDAFLNMTGYTRGDLPLRWRDLTPPEWAHLDEQAVREVRTNGYSAPREKEYIHRDGHRVPILIGTALLDKGSGECIGFVIDLTERKQSAERIRELTSRLEGASRLSVMGEMTAGLAHELHQPLAVIANYANGCIHRLNKETLDRSKLIESLQEVVSQSIRAGEILRRTRDFLHQRETQRGSVNINSVIRDAVHLAELDSREKEVEILMQPELELPDVFGDAVQLTQVLLNLLLNGIQATADNPAGPRSVVVTSSIDDHGQIRVTVADAGLGIPAELRDCIFDQFFTTKSDGLGMGLAICKSTIENHDGKIWMTPHSNGGTEFTLTLPPVHQGTRTPETPEVRSTEPAAR